jgi:hypothetical protein
MEIDGQVNAGVINSIPVSCFKDFMDKSVTVQKANNFELCVLRESAQAADRSVQDLTHALETVISGMQSITQKFEIILAANSSLERKLSAMYAGIKRSYSGGDLESCTDSDSEEEVTQQVKYYAIIYHAIIFLFF